MDQWWRILLLIALAFIPSESTSVRSKSHLGKKDCSAQLAGKQIQIEYAYAGYESFFLTFVDANYFAKVKWIEAEQTKDPANDYVWRIHPCGETLENITSVCIEIVHPDFNKYFLRSAKKLSSSVPTFRLEYISSDRLTQTDELLHFGIVCQDCGETSNTATGCELYFPSLRCKIYAEYSFLNGDVLWCEDDKPDEWYQFNIRFNGHTNGVEKKEIKSIVNCSPGGQTLTSTFNYEEGVSNSNTNSHTHSVEFEIGLNKIISNSKVTQKNDWSFATEISTEQRKSTSITIQVPAGQSASVWQNVIYLGDYEVLSVANYTTSYCEFEEKTDLMTFDQFNTIREYDNCFQRAVEQSINVQHNQGIVQESSNWHTNENGLAVNPNVLRIIKNATEMSPNITNLAKWQEMDFRQFAQFSKVTVDVKIPPGQILKAKQLVLYHNDFVVYSGIINSTYEDCNNLVGEESAELVSNASDSTSSYQRKIIFLRNCALTIFLILGFQFSK